MKYIKASGLPFDPRPQMSRIFVECFHDHGLKSLCKDKAKLTKAMAHIFHLEHFYVALDGEKIAGFVGCVDKKPPPISLDRKILRREMGFVRGTITYFALNYAIINKPYPFAQPPQSGSIEFVATAPEYQGRGVAFGLLSHVMEIMPYSKYVLEVVGINAVAIRLYEKLGFAEFMRTPAPKQSGLGHFVYMRKI